MKHSQVNTYDLDGNWTGIQETWTGTVAEIEAKFHVKIMNQLREVSIYRKSNQPIPIGDPILFNTVPISQESIPVVGWLTDGESNVTNSLTGECIATQPESTSEQH